MKDCNMEESLDCWAEELTVTENSLLGNDKASLDLNECMATAWSDEDNDEFTDESLAPVNNVVKSKIVDRKQRYKASTPFYDRPVVSFDTEYTLSECGKYNRVISYQFAVLHKGKLSTLVLYPDSTKR